MLNISKLQIFDIDYDINYLFKVINGFIPDSKEEHTKSLAAASLIFTIIENDKQNTQNYRQEKRSEKSISNFIDYITKFDFGFKKNEELNATKENNPNNSNP